jgi:nucleotide-binding universal stress UspA family protein
MPGAPHLLLCYDGSDEAAHAIDAAAAFVPPGSPATVLYVREPALAGTPGGIVPVAVPPEVEERDAARARQVAADGAAHAQRMGLVAGPRVEVADGPAWQTIVEVADREADLVVMGTRGLSGLREVLSGSVSHHVAQHVRRPVLIVPSTAAA